MKKYLVTLKFKIRIQYINIFFCFRTHFVHDSDSLVLEDELQRIKLVGECIDVHSVVTGVVCALLGMVLTSISSCLG